MILPMQIAEAKGKDAMAKVGLVVLILGLVGVLLGGGILVVSLLLPTLTEGRTSWDEALLGIIPGALVLAISFVVAAAGLAVMLLKRKRRGTAA